MSISVQISTYMRRHSWNSRKMRRRTRKTKNSSSLCVALSIALVLLLFAIVSSTSTTATLASPSSLSETISLPSRNQPQQAARDGEKSNSENNNRKLLSFPFRRNETCPRNSARQFVVSNITKDQIFWWEAQTKYCDLLRELKGNRNLQQDSSKEVRLRLVWNCTYLTRDDGLGTGNWLVAIYMARLVSAYAGVDLEVKCSAYNLREDILGWLQGCFDHKERQRWWTTDEEITEELACTWDMKRIPLYLVGQEIQDDIRFLAGQVTGIEDHRDLKFSTPIKTELFGTVEFDQVAIHLRCGDILKLRNPRGDYGFTRFSEYKKRISPQAKSIGIITQPFDKDSNREKDREHTDHCRDIATSLVKYLEAAFPEATIKIRNSREQETLVLAYVRLAVAQQTIIGLSSFGAFPTLAGYGEKYFEPGRLLVNKWLNFVPKFIDGLHPIERGQFLKNRNIMAKGINFTKDWLVT